MSRVESEPGLATTDAAGRENAAGTSTGVDGGESSGDMSESVEPFPGPHPAGRWLALMAVLVLVVVLALVGGVLEVVRVTGARTTEADRTEALRIARDAATALIIIDGRDAKQNLDRLLGESSAPLRDQLVQFAPAFQAIVTQGRVESQGQITSAGVESLDENGATVLLGVDTTVRNTEIPQGAPRNFRIAVGLRHDGDRWLASSLDVVP